MKKDDRIRHDYLGRGTIIEVVIKDSLFKVLFDLNPPKRYNFGNNPCIIHKEKIIEVLGNKKDMLPGKEKSAFSK